MSTNKNRIIGGFEDSFEKGKANLSDSTKKTTSDFAKTTKNQLIGGGNSNSNSVVGDGLASNAFDQQAGETAMPKASDQGTNEMASAAVNNQNNNSDQKSDEERIKFLRDLYGTDGSTSSNSKNEKKDNNKKKNNSSDVKQAFGFLEKDPHEGMTPEEAARYEAAKRQLHGDYYQDFLEKTKTKEPSVMDKLEHEEQEERMKEFEMQQKEEKRKLPVTVKQGTAETAIGTVG